MSAIKGAIIMYQLLRSLSTQALVRDQLPVFLISFIIASVFYKFGKYFLFGFKLGFAAECVAFLATWYVLDLVYSTVVKPRFFPTPVTSSTDV